MAEFVPVARADALEEGDMRAFDVRGTRIAVANTAGTFHAFDDTCTHRQCSLAEGDLEDTTGKEGGVEGDAITFKIGGRVVATGIWHAGTFSGVVSFVGINPGCRSAMIGYWLGAEYEGKGIMTRACKALIDYGFGDLSLNRIVIRAATENVRSQAVPLRLGFTREGVEREAEWLNDHFLDMIVYSMLRSEWQVRT